jgi:hypothetical protein
MLKSKGLPGKDPLHSAVLNAVRMRSMMRRYFEWIAPVSRGRNSDVIAGVPAVWIYSGEAPAPGKTKSKTVSTLVLIFCSVFGKNGTTG